MVIPCNKVSLNMVSGGLELQQSVNEVSLQLADIAINVKMFGAKGDSVAGQDGGIAYVEYI